MKTKKWEATIARKMVQQIFVNVDAATKKEAKRLAMIEAANADDDEWESTNAHGYGVLDCEPLQSLPKSPSDA